MCKLSWLLFAVIVKISIFFASANQDDLGCRQAFSGKLPLSKVLVIYTGGTIGMVPHNKTCRIFVNRPNAFVEIVRNNKRLNDKSQSSRRRQITKSTTFHLPIDETSTRRIEYTMVEWEHLMDSVNADIKMWRRMAEDIESNYKAYDGFVVLHGTDTLAYSSSVLSFMLGNLKKTVVVTGSQVPMSVPVNDGVDNFVGALTIAGSVRISQVVVFFSNKLMRGNRVMKLHSLQYEAFFSPNYPPIYDFTNKSVEMQDISMCVTKFKGEEDLIVSTNFTENVALVKIYPTMNVGALKDALRKPIEGAVIESFGAGNMPTARVDLMKIIKEASDRGVILINVSQCPTGGVKLIYETGELSKYGVISGHDMTHIAAHVKLMYVLSMDWDLNRKKQAMEENLRGELTPPEENETDVTTEPNHARRFSFNFD